MSDGSVTTVLRRSVSYFRIFDKNVICVKGEIVGNVLDCPMLYVLMKLYEVV